MSSIKSASTDGGPFGCVIVKDNIIIAEGFNRVTSLNDPTAHGEIVAIREAKNLILLTFLAVNYLVVTAQCVYLPYIGVTFFVYYAIQRRCKK